MARIVYPSTSVYATTPQLSWRIGRYEHRAIPPQASDEPFLVTMDYAERPDKLAATLYGTHEYYFVFMLRNMNLIRDPIFDMTVGMTIMVPSMATVRALFG